MKKIKNLLLAVTFVFATVFAFFGVNAKAEDVTAELEYQLSADCGSIRYIGTISGVAEAELADTTVEIDLVLNDGTEEKEYTKEITTVYSSVEGAKEEVENTWYVVYTINDLLGNDKELLGQTLSAQLVVNDTIKSEVKSHEIDVVVAITQGSASYNFTANGVNGTEYFAITNGGVVNDYLKLVAGSQVVIKTVKGAIITISDIFDGWDAPAINGVDYDTTLTSVSYTTTADGYVTISVESAGSQLAFKNINVTVPAQLAVIEDGYSYTYSQGERTAGASIDSDSNEYMEMSGCTAYNGSYLSIKGDNYIKLNVLAGSTITFNAYVAGNYAFKIVDGETETVANSGSFSYVVQNDGNLFIKAADGKEATISSFSVAVGLVTITTNQEYAFATQGLNSSKYFELTNCKDWGNGYLTLVAGSTINMKVAAGATITFGNVYTEGYGSIAINGVDQALESTITYTATADGEITITLASDAEKACFKTISVTYSA